MPSGMRERFEMQLARAMERKHALESEEE